VGSIVSCSSTTQRACLPPNVYSLKSGKEERA
jgi:hypothetical protein